MSKLVARDSKTIPQVDTYEELRLDVASKCDGTLTPFTFPSEELAKSEALCLYIGYYIVKAMNQHQRCLAKYADLKMSPREVSAEAKRIYEDTIKCGIGYWDSENSEDMSKKRALYSEKSILRQQVDNAGEWEEEAKEWLNYAKALSVIAGVDLWKPRISVAIFGKWFQGKDGIQQSVAAHFACKKLLNSEGNPYTYETATKAMRLPGDNSELSTELKEELDSLWGARCKLRRLM